MHSFTLNCDTFSIKEKVAVVVPVTSVEVTCSKAMVALNFSTLLVVFDENTGKVGTRINVWRYFWWMSI